MDILKNGWLFFQDQILGMKWMNLLIGNLLNRLGLNAEETIGGMLQFFIYDTIKIFILLSILIFLISYIQSFFPPERSRKILENFHGIRANILGALLGTVTPFCSCSSIPIFMGFTSAGLPLGVTFSFLISSPMVDLGSLVLLMSIFGGKIAIAYVIVGLVIAVAGGSVIEKMHMEDQVEAFIRQAVSADTEDTELTVRDRMEYGKEQVIETVRKVAPYIFVGVGIGAVIHNLIPEVMAVKNIIDGKQTATIFKNTELLAEKCSGMVRAVIEGSEPEVNDTTTYDNGKMVVPSYLCEPLSLDKDNYRELVIDSGYYKEEEILNAK